MLSPKVALQYLEVVVLVLHLAERLDRAEAESRHLDALLDRLVTVEPASRGAWVLLGRIARHVCAALEEADDIHQALARELVGQVMQHIDSLAAAERPKGS